MLRRKQAVSFEAIFVRVPLPLAQKSKSCGRLDGEDLAREIGRTPGCCEVDDNEASCGSQAFVEVLSAWFRPPPSHQDTFCHQAKAWETDAEQTPSNTRKDTHRHVCRHSGAAQGQVAQWYCPEEGHFLESRAVSRKTQVLM